MRSVSCFRLSVKQRNLAATYTGFVQTSFAKVSFTMFIADRSMLDVGRSRGRNFLMRRRRPQTGRPIRSPRHEAEYRKLHAASSHCAGAFSCNCENPSTCGQTTDSVLISPGWVSGNLDYEANDQRDRRRRRPGESRW